MTMKGFGIEVKNTLLEPKHRKAMGEAVWLYLWFLDRVTSITEQQQGLVLGRKPIIHADVVEDLHITHKTYARWISRLRNNHYIDTTRAPYGLVVKVNKIHKPQLKKRYAKNVTSLSKSGTSPGKSGTSNKTSSGTSSGTKGLEPKIKKDKHGNEYVLTDVNGKVIFE